MTGKNNEKIIIIGAGVAGLATAQILRRYDIPFDIFERTEDMWESHQGWAVGLMQCLPQLVSLLPADLGDIQQTSVSYAVSEPDMVCWFDGASGDALRKHGGAFAGQSGEWFLRAQREGLRRYLTQHLPIHTGRKFKRYTEDERGVVAFFEDGYQIRGSLLVGADGAYSKVRQQLLGTSQMPILSPMIPMNGTFTLPRELHEPLRRRIGSIFLSDMNGVFYNVGVLSIKPDRSSADFYFGVTFRGKDPETDSQRKADATTQYKKCVELTEPMADWLTELLAKSRPEGMNVPPIKFVEYVPPNPGAWPKTSRVTIIGDAAHTMIPLGGLGANTALSDACDLSTLIEEELRKAKGQSPDFAAVVQAYIARMTPRGREAVLASRAVGLKGL